MRAFAGTPVVAPFVAAADTRGRSRKQQGSLLTVAAVVSSEFKENAVYSNGKVAKASTL